MVFNETDKQVRQIAKVFADNQWKWWGLGLPDGVPNAADVADFLNSLLRQLRSIIENDGSQSNSFHSGRLFVTIDYYLGREHVIFGIEFDPDDPA